MTEQPDPRFHAWLVDEAPRRAPDVLISRSLAILERDPRQISRGWLTARRLAFLPAAAAVVVVAILGAMIYLPASHGAAPGASWASSSPTETQQLESPLPVTATAPIVPEPSSNDPAAGLPYSCGNGEIFHVESLSAPANATDGTDPAAAPIQPIATRLGLSATNWWLVYRSDTTAQFLGRTSAGTYEFVVTERKPGGDWGFKGSGDCQMRYLARGYSTLTWWVDPAFPLTADAREIHLIAADPCQPVGIDGRVQTPLVRYGTESILVVMTATQGPNSDVCGTGPSIALTIQLDQAIASRTVLDGGSWPSRDATAKP
jgi:hypothetical protein